MSVSAMKYALDVLDNYVEDPRCETHCVTAIHFLRQAIAEAEKQEPVAWREVAGKTTQYYDYNEQGRGEPLYAHAIDISQKRVDETAKREHEPVAWHEPGAYGNVTTHKDWALANGWEPLYKEKNS
jgi:hypothetical protein